jgi:thioredoxin 1
MNNQIIELNEANFEQEVLHAGQPVLALFWACWSGSCKAMGPVLESVAGNGAVPVKLGRVDVESQERLAEQYGVRAVPTVLIFNEGGLHDLIVGRATAENLREKLERLR